METEIKNVTVLREKNKVKVLVPKLFIEAAVEICFVRLSRNIIVSVAESDNRWTMGTIGFLKKQADGIYQSIGYMDITERDTHDTLWRVQPKPPENPDIMEASERISSVKLGSKIVMFLTD